MQLSTNFIQKKFSHVFNNEFQERKILHSFYDADWGKELHTQAVLDLDRFNWAKRTAQDWAVLKAQDCRLILTETKEGIVQLFRFWQNLKDGKFCYNEINLSEMNIRRNSYGFQNVECEIVK